MKKGAVLLIIFDIFIAACFFTFYGPIGTFRDFLVTTAMTSKDHKFIARTFYSEDYIKKIMSENTITSKDKSNSSLITIGEEDLKNANEYEKEILVHGKNELYKIVEFDYNGYHCWLTAIYDPGRVKLIHTRNLGVQGETLREMAIAADAKVAINGGGFRDPQGTGNGGIPKGVIIKDGELVWGDGNTYYELVGFDNRNIMTLTTDTAYNAIANGMRDAVCFGPFLIVDGEPSTVTGNGGWGTNPRTAIAQRKDGIVLFLTVDGNGLKTYNYAGRGGVSMSELIEILQRYGAYNAANMDGGASTNLVINGELTNHPCAFSDTGERYLPDGWMVK